MALESILGHDRVQRQNRLVRMLCDGPCSRCLMPVAPCMLPARRLLLAVRSAAQMTGS